MNNIENDGDQMLLEDDYYQLLNIDKSANTDEINSAYRRCSRIFHPDKHGPDPTRIKWAEQIFNKVKEAYEVLSDPHRRAIYDTLGKRGLEVDGWEIIFRSRTPKEIREEYERLKKERMERRLQQSTNPHVTITTSINATDLFTQYYDDNDEPLLPTIEVSGMAIQQSIEVPATTIDTVTVSSQISTQNGIGTGSINVSNRRVTSEKGWMDMDFSIGNGPALGFKAFRTLSRVLYLTGGTALQFTSKGISLNLVTTFAAQLDNHSVGYLTYRANAHGNSMTTTFVRDTEHHHANVAIQLGTPHTMISLNYVRKLPEMDLKLRLCLKAGTFGAIVEYGAERKISQHTSVSAAVMVGFPTGVILKLKWIRSTHSIVVPIHLCEEVIPAPVFYATVVPILSWLTVKKLIIDPINKEKHEREMEKSREANRERIQEMKKTARATVELMTETYSRIRSNEEKKNGLVLIKAVYGKLPAGAEHHNIPEEESVSGGDGSEPQSSQISDTFYGVQETADVTIPLQCLVKDSRLELLAASKSQLAGFYDPCIGEDKHLTIKYSFHKRLYLCTIADAEAVTLPRLAHKISRS